MLGNVSLGTSYIGWKNDSKRVLGTRIGANFMVLGLKSYLVISYIHFGVSFLIEDCITFHLCNSCYATFWFTRIVLKFIFFPGGGKFVVASLIVEGFFICKGYLLKDLFIVLYLHS